MDRTRNAPHARSIRAHYRQYLEERDGVDYNPVLDDPDDPRNIRHWAHGMAEGYRQAGCKCRPADCRCAPSECECTDSCAEAGRRANRAGAELRLETRLASQKVRATMLLARMLDLDGDTAATGAAAVVATHRVVSLFRAKVAYSPVAVRLALRDWDVPAIRTMSEAELSSVVAALLEAMA